MEKLTEERFIEIFDEDSKGEFKGDNSIQGLLIMAKYLPLEKHTLIQGADHDVIWGPGIDELIEAGITEEDAVKIRDLNWMIEDQSYMAHYV